MKGFAAMELRYAGILSLVVILAFAGRGTASRPVPGFTSESSGLTTADVNTGTSSKVNVPMSESTVLNDLKESEPKAPIMMADILAGFGESDATFTREERMLATTMDYPGPGGNENPKHNP